MSKGFTLAEVLITIGIIGVVAALVTPSLINSTRNKELEALFKTANSSLAQALLKVKYEVEDLNSVYNGGYITSQEDGKHLHELLGEQFSSAIIKDMTPQEDRLQIKTFTGEQTNLCTFDDGYILAAGKMDIYFETVCDKFITIDTNGFAKGPNRFGYDFFMFVIGKNDALIPVGSPMSKGYKLCVGGASATDLSNLNITCSENSASELNGFGCTYKAVNDPNYFKNLTWK